MPADTDIRIDTKAVDDLLKKLANKVAHPKDILSEIGEIILFSVQKNFEAQGRPNKWERLSEKSTIPNRIKKKKWPGKILQVSGSYGLLGSIIPKATDERLVVGTNKVYAAVQQFGAAKGSFGTVSASIKTHQRRHWKTGKKFTVKAHERRMTVPWGPIPARPYLMIQDSDWPDIRETLLRKLTETK